MFNLSCVSIIKDTCFIAFVTLVVCLFSSCQQTKKETQNVKLIDYSKPYPLPITSSDIKDSSQLATYQFKYFWNNFDFNDAMLHQHQDYLEQAVVDYINLFPQIPEDVLYTGMSDFIFHSKKDSQNFVLFKNTVERYLYDPNSPTLNEYYYALYVQALLANDVLNSADKIKYETLLPLLILNKPGSIANNFNFILSSGKRTQLHNIKADYLFLMFYEPGCKQCEETIQLMRINEDFNHWIKQGKLVVLAIYPDGNSNIWKTYQENIPSNWLNGLDEQLEVLKRGLYQIRATPTIYLLDQSKRVLLKDVPMNVAGHYLKEHLK